jgi:hypothetical protein
MADLRTHTGPRKNWWSSPFPTCIGRNSSSMKPATSWFGKVAMSAFSPSVEAESTPYESPRTGAVPPAHLTSDGKALLADLPAAEFDRPYPRQGFQNSDWVPMSSPSCVEISTQPADASMAKPR